MSTIFITTLGCKVNQYESETLSDILREKGHFITERTGAADILVVNTCTVTGKASMQSRQSIRRLHRENPLAPIIVTGCYAETERDEILKISGVSRVVPNHDKKAIPSHIEELIPPVPETGTPLNLPSPRKTSSRTRPFVKIQDGCNTFCSYCIVPYARGRSKSLSPGTVRKEVEKIADAGHSEIVLTGIHIGSYGLDLSPPTNLFNLLKDLTGLGRPFRIRISSIEPQELSDAIIELTGESQRGITPIAEHFHIPLQSGDDAILERMRRPYTSSFFRSRVEKIRKTIPHAGIGSDILVGFPGETDDAFENTYETVASLPLTYLHVFPFSARPKTPAFHFPDKVAHDIIRKRSERMRRLGVEKKRLFYETLIGKTCEVIAEGKRDEKTGWLKGLTTHYVPVLFEGDDRYRNQRSTVRIERVLPSLEVCGKRIESVI